MEDYYDFLQFWEAKGVQLTDEQKFVARVFFGYELRNDENVARYTMFYMPRKSGKKFLLNLLTEYILEKGESHEG